MITSIKPNIHNRKSAPISNLVSQPARLAPRKPTCCSPFKVTTPKFCSHLTSFGLSQNFLGQSVNNNVLNGNNIKCLNNVSPYFKQDTYFFTNQVISFGSKKNKFAGMLKGKYHFSDAQAKFIIKNQIDEYENISPENFDSDVADLYLNEKQKREFFRIKTLFNLNLDESLGAIAYNLSDEQIKHYLDLKTKYPNLMLAELILITKFGLTEEQITRFFEIKSKRFQYEADNQIKKTVLQIDEAIFCAKEEYKDEQIKQFLKLRNKTKDLRNYTIRGIGATPSASFKYAIDCIDDNKSDDDIQEEDEIMDLAGNGNSLELFASLTKEQRIRYQNIDFNPSKEEYDEFSLTIYQSLGDEANLLDESPSSIEMLNGIYRYSLAGLSDEQFSIYNELISAGLNKYMAVNMAVKINKDQCLKFKNLVEQGENPSIAIKKATTHPEIYQLLYEEDCSLEEKIAKTAEWFDIHKEELYNEQISQCPKEQQVRYYNLLDLGYDYKDAYNLSFLTEEQYEKYMNFPDEFKSKYWAIDVARLSPEEYERFEELSCDATFNMSLENYYMGFEKRNPIEITKLSDKDYKRFLAIRDELYDSEELFHLVMSYSIVLDMIKNSPVSSLYPEIYEKLPENIWFLISTGEEKEVYDIIDEALSKILQNDMSDFTPLESDLTDENGNFKGNNFSVNIKKLTIKDKPVLVISDNESDEKFIAYNGAIARVNSIQHHEYQSQYFESHCNLLQKAQNKCLALASNYFLINLYDDKNNSLVISEGLDKNVIGIRVLESLFESKTTEKTKLYYGKLFTMLKQHNKLTVENILKIMPLFSALSINSCTTDGNGNMLYSISCEWMDKDDKKWQMRVHSQDLKYPPSQNSSNWIVRLGYEENNQVKYFQFDDFSDGYNFDGVHSGSESKNSHIEIPTPIENSLINNIDFQKIIRKLSTEQHESFKISTIANKLQVSSGAKTDEEKITKIIADCLINPLHYLQFKDTVDRLRNNLGMINLNT